VITLEEKETFKELTSNEKPLDDLLEEDHKEK
jgi:hypothetical protein